MKAPFIAAALSFVVATFPAHASTSFKKIPAQKNAVVSNKIDLNKADLSSLIGSFKGIGKKRAEAIIAYREAHQGFKSIEELGEVKGFGQHFIVTHRKKLSEVFVVN